MIRTVDTGKRRRLAIILLVGALIIAGIVVGRAVSSRRVNKRADRAAADIERVLRDQGAQLVDDYPVNAAELDNAFARMTVRLSWPLSNMTISFALRSRRDGRRRRDAYDTMSPAAANSFIKL